MHRVLGFSVSGLGFKVLRVEGVGFKDHQREASVIASCSL